MIVLSNVVAAAATVDDDFAADDADAKWMLIIMMRKLVFQCLMSLVLKLDHMNTLASYMSTEC